MQDALDGETAAAELNAAMQMREAGDFRAAALRMQELRKQAHTELEATRLALLEANCWTSAGDVRRARQLLDDAECFASQDRSLKLVLEHETARLERVLGQRQRALERTERIQEDFKDLFGTPEWQPMESMLKNERALLFSELHRYETALPLLLDVHQNEPDDPEILFSLGQGYFHTRKFDEAAKYLMKTLQNTNLRTSLKSITKYLLAYSQYNLGAYGQAIHTLQDLEGDPVDEQVPRREIYAMLADSFSKIGMEDESRRYRALVHGAS